MIHQAWALIGAGGWVTHQAWALVDPGGWMTHQAWALVGAGGWVIHQAWALIDPGGRVSDGGGRATHLGAYSRSSRGVARRLRIRRGRIVRGEPRADLGLWTAESWPRTSDLSLERAP